jgi:hypothetical protein
LRIYPERRDLDERVALACSGRDLEARGIVFDEPLGAIIVRVSNASTRAA